MKYIYFLNICTCGEITYGNHKYCHGHNNLNISFSKEHKLKISIANKGQIPFTKGKHLSEEHKYNISKGNYGKKKKLSERNISYRFKRFIERLEKEIKGIIPWNKDTKGICKLNKTSFQKGLVPWNKGIFGKDSHAWKGNTIEKYPRKFYIISESIRIRDNYICQYPGCLCTQFESKLFYKQKLHVHHIDYDKTNCEEWNLISLCIKHNSIV